MTVTAKLKYLRIAPRKVRLIADLIRDKRTQEALNILNFTEKKTSDVMKKLLNQAISNAKNNFKLDESNLYISKITVDEGPKLKRFRPRARGSANEIQKKTSHINISLDEAEKRSRKLENKEEKKTEISESVDQINPEKIKKSESPKIKPEFETVKPKVQGTKRRFFRRQTF